MYLQLSIMEKGVAVLAADTDVRCQETYLSCYFGSQSALENLKVGYLEQF